MFPMKRSREYPSVPLGSSCQLRGSACPGARCCLWLLEAPGMICEHGMGAEICMASGKEFVIIRNTLAPEPWANSTVACKGALISVTSLSSVCSPWNKHLLLSPGAPFLALALGLLGRGTEGQADCSHLWPGSTGTRASQPLHLPWLHWSLMGRVILK